MRLVTVAHGTRSPAGNRVAAAITRAAGQRLGIAAHAAYIELCEPLVTAVLAASDEPTVVVPLLLSTGYHVRVDLPAAAATARGPVALGRPLGPDPALAHAMTDRLRAAGARPGQPTVLVAAGSHDPATASDLDGAADLLHVVCEADVQVATLAGAGARIADVVRPGDAVVPYLLADGFFATQAADQARAMGASPIADVIGAHERVIGLVVARALALAGQLSATPASPPALW